ncbi:MAG: hypothetical protein ABEJ46_05485 [Gemmatimonadota bacterium]
MKATWGRRVAWSTIAAVLVHGGLFVLLPDWAPDDPPRNRSPRPLAMEEISAAALSSAGGGVVATAVPVEAAPDSAPEEGTRSAADDGSGSSEGRRAEPASR